MGGATASHLARRGHRVNLWGTELDREIISFLRKSRKHKTLGVTLPENVLFFQAQELEEALGNAEIVIVAVVGIGGPARAGEARMSTRKCLWILLTCLLLVLAVPSASRPADDLVSVIKKVKPAVVKVICKDFGSVGSGFIISPDGYAITCFHVVAKTKFESGKLRVEYAKHIEIRFYDGRT